MSVQVLRRHFSVGDYYTAACVGRLTELPRSLPREVAILWVQNPVQVNDYSEPVPDVTLLKRRDDFYARANPGPEGVLLLIEVSDSTLEYDRQIKVPLYARAGIPEVWLVNLPEGLIEVCSRPSGGKYKDGRVVGRGESLTSASVPSLTLDADAVLG